jgi:hypothetical protein
MPESDPDDGESDDPFVLDLMRDLSNVGYDDAFIDVIGSGHDVEYAKPSADQDLADMLTAWRNDVDREPLNLDLPSGPTARGELPLTPSKGTPVSNTEDAGKLEEMSSGGQIQSAAAALTQADSALGDLSQKAQTVVSEGQPHEAIQGAIQQARSEIATITQMLALVQQAFQDAAGKLRNV